MSSTMTGMTIVGALAVFIVLVMGILTLGKEESQSLSQKLMRWRVGLQFLAVVLIMATIAVKRGF
jgi:hypothetical protein